MLNGKDSKNNHLHYINFALTDMSAAMKMSNIYHLYFCKRNTFSCNFWPISQLANSMYMHNHHAQLRVFKQFEQDKVNLLEL